MAAERVHLLTVGYEFVPRAWTLEGETDESSIRLPLTALLVRTEGKWFLFDTGLGPEFHDVEEWARAVLEERFMKVEYDQHTDTLSVFLKDGAEVAESDEETPY